MYDSLLIRLLPFGVAAVRRGGQSQRASRLIEPVECLFGGDPDCVAGVGRHGSELASGLFETQRSETPGRGLSDAPVRVPSSFEECGHRGLRWALCFDQRPKRLTTNDAVAVPQQRQQQCRYIGVAAVQQGSQSMTPYGGAAGLTGLLDARGPAGINIPWTQAIVNISLIV